MVLAFKKSSPSTGLVLLILLCFYSMDGFRLVKLNEVIRQVDIVITCTGMAVMFRVWGVRFGNAFLMEQVKGD